MGLSADRASQQNSKERVAQKRAPRAKAFVGATGTYLHGIGADDLAGEPLGQLDGQLGLPGAGGPEYNHQRHPRPHLVAGLPGCHYYFIEDFEQVTIAARRQTRARQPFESCEFSQGRAGGRTASRCRSGALCRSRAARRRYDLGVFVCVNLLIASTCTA